MSIAVDFTQSYLQVIPTEVLQRYHWAETRNAAAIIRATNPGEFDDLVDVLADFQAKPELDIFPPGGNESLAAGRLNNAFRHRGWREASYRVRVSSELTLVPWGADAGPAVIETQNDSTSYLVDNVKGRVAIDVEWHAKDGNLDRDLAAYRSLHAETIVDGAAIVTMNRAQMRLWAVDLDPQTRKFSTSTTTNLEKLRPRLIRGDGGGCPILVAAIGQATI